MNQPLFYAPRLKVKRARQHTKALEELSASLIKNRPFSVVAEPHPESADHWQCVMRECQPMPEEVPLLLGDAIHNLRTALDLLAGDLVRANGADPSGVYFPFCDDPDYLDQMIKRRNMDRAAPDVVDILRSMKPYKGGNKALRALHDLDIADKHKLLIPALSAILHPSYEIDFINQIEIVRDPKDCVAIVQDGALIEAAVPNTIPVKAFTDKKYLITFVFDADQPMAGESVTPTLQDLAKLVDGIIDTFATHLQGNQPVP